MRAFIASLRSAARPWKLKARALRRTVIKRPFSTASYWEKRYKTGGNSGSGSYGRLARYKTEFINAFIRSEAVSSVIDFGCGDGAQIGTLDIPEYTGIDISPTTVARCREMYSGRPGWRFFTAADKSAQSFRADMAMSIDVIFHLLEDRVYDAYMRRLFDSANRFVMIYSSDREENTGTTHVRHHAFSDWVKQNRPGWVSDRIEPNPFPYDPADPDNTSHAHFAIFRRQ